MAEQRTYTLTRPVFFVGFMGAGKTSLARRLARNLGLSAIDADTYLARDLGMTAGDFIREYGEPAFRKEETRVLKELLERDPALISCGGGVVEMPENRELLKDAFAVYLKVTADQARARISSLASRPLFGDIEQARALNARRAPLYAEVADITIEAGEKPIALVAEELRPLLEAEGVLCLQQNS